MTLVAAVATAGIVVARAPDTVIRCRLSSERPRPVGQTTFLYAADGSRLGAIPTTRNREPVPLARMSHWLPAATVAVEDRRFWQHGGLDYAGIVRAAIADVKAHRLVQGGSTLAQQLVRDRYLGRRPATLGRKLTEACLAIQLERASSKRQILEAYLNSVYYGHFAYGVEAAAQTYFGRPARSLGLGQAALLAGLPQAPSEYDPFRHPDVARARRDEVLAALRSSRQISRARYDAAVARPVRLHAGSRYATVRAGTFFGDVRRGLDREYGPTATRHGGLDVRTTLDAGLQRDAEQAIAKWVHDPFGPAAALVAIDPASGAVRAMASAAPGAGAMRFNLASQSHRQAGSAFKVFTLTAAIEQGIPLSSVWHGPSSLTIPNRSCLNANGEWTVHNFADESSGTMTLREAIAHSVNTIFAQVALRVGPRAVVDAAHRLGIRSPLRPVCSITLGPEGVSPLEMANAFATLAAGGVRHRAQELQSVTAPGGRVLARLSTRGRRVLSPGEAGQVTSALTGVIKGGTGTAADPGRPAAGKTGTAESFKDAWFCGFVPQLAACVWLGHPQAEIPMHGVDGFAQVVGGSVPARIWHDFMVPAMQGRPVVPLQGARR